jgi:Sec-independent protein secretion pathway component TatC
MKSVLIAVMFFVLGLCISYFIHTPIAHAQVPKQSQPLSRTPKSSRDPSLSRRLNLESGFQISKE